MIENLLNSKRILIQGSSGAGKSTFSQYLSKKLGISLIHMDKEHWRPNWQKPDPIEWRNRQAEFIAKDKWIIEGGAYKRTLPERSRRSDFIIYLDFNRFFCLYRCFKRFFQYRNKTRPDMANGCNEQVSLSFIKWILWDQPQVTSPMALKVIKENSKHENLFIIKNAVELEKLKQAIDDALK